MKISNATSNDKDECVNQCARVLEDALNKLYKIKGNRDKALNYSIVDADNC